MFNEIVEISIKRILGLLDRNPASKTYGCFDRHYWKYLYKDYPNMWYQSGILFLTLAYKFRTNVTNIFYKNENIREYVIGIIKFIQSQRYSTGGFNEAYPHEESYCTTAFTNLNLILSKKILDIKYTKKNLVPVAYWLFKNRRPETSNQYVAALFNMYLISELTGDVYIKEYYNIMKQELITIVKKHKYLPEYGGLDIGYLSFTLSILTQFLQFKSDDQISEICKSIAKIINSNLDETGIISLNARSRGMQYVYPSGLYYHKSPAFDKIVNGLEKKVLINPLWLDDLYFIYLSIDYFLTYLYQQGISNVFNN